MIELIFVIVILGILSAVALPKFIGVTGAANATVCQAFVGTLNRTVSHSIWAESILNVPYDYNITEPKLVKNVKEKNECGTFSQYVAATYGTPFTVHIGDHDYNVSAVAADSEGPAKWSWSKL
jgi:Tfp pilus assembly protein PilE